MSAETQPSSHGLSAEEMAERNRQMGRKLTTVIVGMFLFGFASIPLYRIVCDKIDPGGSAWSNGTKDSYKGVVVDRGRTIKVNFITNVNRRLPWAFEGPVDTTVHPGERRPVKFIARNLTNLPVKGKAVYDINPPEAGQYFKKIECFCFQEQLLEGKASAEMPLVFWFKPDIPPHINDITIAYTFFNMESSLEQTQKRAGR